MSKQTLTVLEAFEKVEEWYYDTVYKHIPENQVEFLPSLVLKLHYGTVFINYGDIVLFDTENSVCYFEGEREGSEYPFGVEDYVSAIQLELKQRLTLQASLYNNIVF